MQKTGIVSIAKYWSGTCPLCLTGSAGSVLGQINNKLIFQFLYR